VTFIYTKIYEKPVFTVGYIFTINSATTFG
jgi:ADP-dependent phosphofructokinase/glucokinase